MTLATLDRALGEKPMRLYKLTDENDQTRNWTQWGPGVTHETNGKGDLCGPGWLHAYTDPRLAILLNPIHANIRHPHLWEAEGSGETKDDHGLKIGVTRLTTICRLPLPDVTLEHRIRFGIVCAWQVCREPAWRGWARAWLDGRDRTMEAADAAAAGAAGWAAAEAAGWAAATEAAAEADTTPINLPACVAFAFRQKQGKNT